MSLTKDKSAIRASYLAWLYEALKLNHNEFSIHVPLGVFQHQPDSTSLNVGGPLYI